MGCPDCGNGHDPYCQGAGHNADGSVRVEVLDQWNRENAEFARKVRGKLADAFQGRTAAWCECGEDLFVNDDGTLESAGGVIHVGGDLNHNFKRYTGAFQQAMHDTLAEMQRR